MSVEEFWSITPRAFFNAVEGFEALHKLDLEVARLQTLCAVNMWAKKPISDPRDLWKYHWEKDKIDEKKIEAQRERGKQLARKWQTK